jgi:cystathionine beta-lyase/cystathionine gamma-synthase
MTMTQEIDTTSVDTPVREKRAADALSDDSSDKAEPPVAARRLTSETPKKSTIEGGCAKRRALTSGEWLPGTTNAFATDLVHSGVSPDEKTGAILTPLYLSTTFVQESVDKYLEKGYSYSRTNNPTVTAYQKKVAELENGVAAHVFGTGMAATAAVINATMKAGDHCIISDCSYGGTNRIMRVQYAPFGMEFTFLDFSDPAAIKAALKPNTRLIFSESPTNPQLRLVDLEAVSAIAKEHGCYHVCDSTFATPVIMRPLDHGCDMTIQSLTKFYEGHNMSTGGAVISKTVELAERIGLVQNMNGSIMHPFPAFLQMQTVKTMELRVRRQSASAMKIAQFLEKHPKVTKVMYPGLASFPQKKLADKYHRDNLHGAMLWFDVEGGSAAGKKLMESTPRPWSLCENLGATESIITASAVMTHANMLKEDRLKVGITDGFIRVSVGIEDPDDLIRSLAASLDAL